MQLDIDLNLLGRKKQSITAEIVRELNPADIALLLSAERGIKTPSITKIKNSHHSIARMFAQGMSGVDISAITGYTQNRLSILKGDPAMEELIAFYKGNNAEAVGDLHTQMALLALDVVQEVADRVRDDAESVGYDQLLDTLKLVADRTGHGPQTKSTNVNVNVDLAGRLSAARQRVVQVSSAPALAPGESPASLDAALPAPLSTEGEKP